MMLNPLSQKISNYAYDGIEYKAYSAEAIKAMFLSWQNGLTFREKLALKMYRIVNILKQQ